jgi:hypothetical protein
VAGIIAQSIRRLAIAGCSASLAVASSAETRCENPLPTDAEVREWARSVAVIVSGPDQSRQYGLGLVVGWDGDRVFWVVTAAHVLTGGRPTTEFPPKPALPIRVTFPDQGGDWKVCERDPLRFRTDFDIAFICVQSETSAFFQTGLLARRVEPVDDFRLLGERGQSTATTIRSPRQAAKGRLASSNNGRISFQSNIGEGGDSGSPIWSDRGIAAIYLSRSNGLAQGVSMSTVQEAAAAARVPWKLDAKTSFDCNFTREVCGAARSAAGNRVDIRLSRQGDTGDVSIPNGKCAIVPEGPYRLISASSAFTCPDTTVFVSESTQALRLDPVCTVELTGIWQSDSTSFMCFPEGAQTRCSGLMELGFGAFSGTASVVSSDVVLTGVFNSGIGRPASGRFRIRDDGLEGSISPSGMPGKSLRFRRQQ